MKKGFLNEKAKEGWERRSRRGDEGEKGKSQFSGGCTGAD